MINLKSRVGAVVLLVVVMVSCKIKQDVSTTSTTVTSPVNRGRVLFIPLDDRPSTFLFVQQIARIGGLNLVVPRRADLGKSLIPGKPEVLSRWLLENAQAGDTAIVSADMLAYGGLIASRMAGSDKNQALSRLEFLKKLAEKGVKIEVFAILPRLSLRTSLDETPAIEAVIRDWAGKIETEQAANPLSVRPRDARAEVDAQLEKYVTEYLTVRARNLAVATEMISFVKNKTINRLVFAQDDANANGLHVRDQLSLRKSIERAHDALKTKHSPIELIQGADEIGMNMISGWLARQVNHQTTVQFVFSDPSAEQRIPPLESHTLGDMLNDHLKIAGARRVESNADVLFFIQTPKQAEAFAVYATVSSEAMLKLEERVASAVTPQDKAKAAEALRVATLKNKESVEHPARVAELVKKLTTALAQEKRVALADLAIINRSDPVLSEAILKDNTIPLWKLEAYAGWNTPANAFGTALSQLVMHRLAQTGRIGTNRQVLLESEKTHQAFLIARMMDDYGYQHLTRDKVRADEVLTKEKSETIASTLFDPSSVFLRTHLLPWAQNLYKTNFKGKTTCLEPINEKVKLGEIDLEAQLPWRRTFEAETRLDLRLVALNQACD